MAYNRTLDTDDSAIPTALRRFMRNRMLEILGAGLFAGLVAVGISLAGWSVDDPSLNHATDAAASNYLGFHGAVIADEIMQVIGLAGILFITLPMAWAVRLLAHEKPENFIFKIIAWIIATLAACSALSTLPTPAAWRLAGGLGGNAGDILSSGVLSVMAFALKGWFPQILTGLVSAYIAFTASLKALGLAEAEASGWAERSMQMAVQLVAWLTAAIGRVWFSWRESRTAAAERAARNKPARPKAESFFARFAPPPRTHPKGRRIEPSLDDDAAEPTFDESEDEQPEDGEEPGEFDDEEESEDDFEAHPAVTVTRGKTFIKMGQKLKKDSQLKLRFGKSSEFELPPLTLLAEPKRSKVAADLSDDVLQQNARMLEGVLEDFGVKGQIGSVRPGPVVTLYELEPAPGIKSSRVISLADDIARSMSAVSARVAVVQGRNAIGIELPNSKRETVYLREMLASEIFEKTSMNLAFALGKNIGGEPIFADLARMPHLLIAGTTGSGKSVGINTMILSLLYRLSPDRCKLIMIDPKMLELSVYEGIPHLLAPVVTDPRKAVVALKWAVREMEDRYRKMSKVGVRNIDGYNARVKQAGAKGEKMSRTVQTGFDPDTGQPIFEQEDMDLQPMPYIVVIIDEMADLMMVAGKDIEGAVQRLAQMARAAGIHVVMATQRPSVDVITGTIKANFPTRISFQVTSKIDSRTILGEQGAEQLLGQGDMLYMAGGGRISRLHGPFVADDEVEKIVKHLKSQGAPEYVDAVTEEPEEGYGDPGTMGSAEGGGSGDDLYDQAVAVVLRDKKVSTSYVQRRLQVGYNKAASLIERMEKEGLISAANATGKREILVPGDSARV
jgi:S-DNA-T family DNA segregation ATPase FtsK/SpoIIIE